MTLGVSEHRRSPWGAEERSEPAGEQSNGVALVRRPGPKLADGLVVRPRPEPIDLGLALDQHARYRDALREAGWQVVEAPPADDLPDAVFVEDTAVVLADRVLLTRPGHPSRAGEVDSVAHTLADLGVPTIRLPPGCRLDGGDVLTVGHTVYIGLSERTDVAAVRAMAALLGPAGWQPRPVRVTGCLHLKSAITALPDGTLFGMPGWVDADALAAPVLPAPEPAGADLLLLGGTRVGVSAVAPRTAALLAARGLDPVSLDVGEFEALDAAPTCLSVLLPRSLWPAGQTAAGGPGPGASGPGASGPGASGPGASGPGASGPGASEPGASGPGASGPGASEPGASEPGGQGHR